MYLTLQYQQWPKVQICVFRNRSLSNLLVIVDCFPDQITWMELLHSQHLHGFDVEQHEIVGLLHRAYQKNKKIARSELTCLVSHTLGQWSHKPIRGAFRVHLVNKPISDQIPDTVAFVNGAGNRPCTPFIWPSEQLPPVEATPDNPERASSESHEIIPDLSPEIPDKINNQRLDFHNSFGPPNETLAIAPTALVEVENPLRSEPQYQVIYDPSFFSEMAHAYEHVGWLVANVDQGRIIPEFKTTWTTRSQEEVERNSEPLLQTHPRNLGCSHNLTHPVQENLIAVDTQAPRSPVAEPLDFSMKARLPPPSEFSVFQAPAIR